MTTASKTASAIALSAVLATALLISGCQSPAADPPASGKSEAPHGYVEGAEETAERQPRLVLADTATGTVGVLDLITGDLTGDLTPAGRTAPVRALFTDGRFAYAATRAGAHVIDGGGWTVDHGDHVHHYRAPVRHLGEIRGEPPARVHGSTAVTSLSSADGTTRLLDRAALEKGEVKGETGEGTALKNPAGPAVPHKDHLVLAGTGPGRDAVEVRGGDGVRKTVLAEKCAEPRGAAVTRRGVVLGCADGALLVTVTGENGRHTGVRIPYGESVEAPRRADRFTHRPGSTTLTARAGRDAVWVLDVTARTWTLIKTGPVTAVNTAGEGAPVLALGEDGVLRAHDPVTGKRTAERRILAATRTGDADAPPPAVEIDADRAYINDTAAKKIHEIDHGDGLRISRTFTLPFPPAHMVETGR
ncbi:lipoprotein [Streptomyces inusitatus]|uniref:Lipoprotein n=1 Tax=Streptomyces inusitatus TaxID=68221 RepID=A0A918PQ16_9ACTN|nr:hypothetical protein [Streptomyces inusitatus]GGZ17813.1 lipoprotein [Streptomyces inusitatus]